MLLLLNQYIDCLYDDLGIDSRSKNYILKRLASEGIKFLTVELPKIAKSVIRGLELGYFDRQDLTSFGFKGSILHLFEELLSRVFCFYTGAVLDEPCSDSIRTIRQAAEYFYKLALEFDDKTEDEAIKNFLSNEKDLDTISKDSEVLVFADQLRKDFETYYPAIARCTVEKIFAAHRPRATNGTFVGCDSKYYFDRISTESSRRLPSTEGYSGFYKPYPSAKLKVLVHNVQDFSELLLVPKDSRGPRTICREDRVRLETQMAYFDFMTENLHKISRHAINFLDQTINRRVAEKSSVTKDYCTLDLKDASDRVSLQVVKTIFRNSPGCYFFVTGDRRAKSVQIHSDSYALKKLAGMGSGLTFPTMSLLISLAICNKVRLRYPHMSYDLIRSKVYVYGDDICCPTSWYDIAVRSLSLIGLKVNVNKSFVRSSFRESCGGDYHNGADVTPIRLRLSNSKPKYVVSDVGIKLLNSPNSFKQLYEHSKECFAKNFKRTSGYLMGILKKVHFELFHFPMSCGKFDMTMPYFVDYTKQTRHLPLGRSATVMTVMPVKHRTSKIINDAGSLLERCPYKYLLSSFNKEATNAWDITIPSSFDEVAIPRALAFAKRSVLTDFIVDDDISFTREHFVDTVKREQFSNMFSALMCRIHLTLPN